MYKLSLRSLKRLEGVNPLLILVVKRALELSEVDFGITEGVRTIERQKELKAAGKSQTLRSKHLTGNAVDVVAYIGEAVSWDWVPYVEISDAFKQAARELDVELVWGGDWLSFKDGCHFQIGK